MWLDSNIYPHLIDQVLLYATPRVLRSFRATSRYYSTKVTSKSAHHMIFYSHVQRSCCANDRLCSKDKVLSLPITVATLQFPDRTRSLLQNTKVLEIKSNKGKDGTPRPVCDTAMEYLLPLLPMLDCLYIYAPMVDSFAPPAHTIFSLEEFHLSTTPRKLVVHTKGRCVVNDRAFPIEVEELVIMDDRGIHRSYDIIEDIVFHFDYEEFRGLRSLPSHQERMSQIGEILLDVRTDTITVTDVGPINECEEMAGVLMRLAGMKDAFEHISWRFPTREEYLSGLGVEERAWTRGRDGTCWSKCGDGYKWFR